MKSEQEYEPQEAAQRIKDNLRKAGYIVSQFRGTFSIGPLGHAKHPPVFLFGEKRVYVNFLNGTAFACKSFRLLVKLAIELFATPESQYKLLKLARFQGWLVEVDGDDWRLMVQDVDAFAARFPPLCGFDDLVGFLRARMYQAVLSDGHVRIHRQDDVLLPYVDLHLSGNHWYVTCGLESRYRIDDDLVCEFLHEVMETGSLSTLELRALICSGYDGWEVPSVGSLEYRSRVT